MLQSKVGCSDNASDLYWGGAIFLSWLGRQLTWYLCHSPTTNDKV